MKTKQVHKNRSASPSKSQAKIPVEFALPPGDVLPHCFCIFDRLSQAPVKKIPVSESDVFELMMLAGEHKKSAELFIAEAIREKLWRNKAAHTQASDEVQKAPQYTLELISFANGKECHEAHVVVPPDKMEILTRKSPHPIIEGQECVDFTPILEEGLKVMAHEPDSSELEEAVRQSCALTKLLFNQTEYTRLTGDDFSMAKNDNGFLTAGLQSLMWVTQERLTKAYMSI